LNHILVLLSLLVRPPPNLFFTVPAISIMTFMQKIASLIVKITGKSTLQPSLNPFIGCA